VNANCPRCHAANELAERDEARGWTECRGCGRPISLKPEGSPEEVMAAALAIEAQLWPFGFTVMRSDVPTSGPDRFKDLAFSTETAPPSGAIGYREPGRPVGPATLVIPWSRLAEHGGCLHAFVIVVGVVYLGLMVLAHGRVSLPLFGVWALLVVLIPLVHRLRATRVTVDGDTLRLRHSNVPWSQGEAWPVRQIEAVHCASLKVLTGQSSYTMQYLVLLLLSDGRWQKLMEHVPSEGDAFFLRDLIRQRLGLGGPVS